MIFKPATLRTFAAAKRPRLDLLGVYSSMRLEDHAHKPWKLAGLTRPSDAVPFEAWEVVVPLGLDTALLRSWAAGDCPSFVLADWIEGEGLPVPADVLAMLREPQEGLRCRRRRTSG